MSSAISHTMTVSTAASAGVIEVVPLVLRPQPNVVEELGKLLLNHKEGDVTSLRLHKWCTKVCQAAQGLDRASQATLVAKKIPRLHAILDNFLQPGSVVEEPLVVEGMLWDGPGLKDFLLLSKLSPFDGKQMHPQPHSFAQAVLKATTGFAVPKKQGDSAHVIPQGASAEIRLLQVKLLAQEYKFHLEAWKHREELRKTKAVYEQRLALLKAQTGEALTSVQRSQREQAVFFHAALDETRASLGKQMGEVEARNRQLAEQVQKAQSEEVALRAKVATQDAELEPFKKAAEAQAKMAAAQAMALERQLEAWRRQGR